MAKVLIPIIDEIEELETVAPADILRKSGAEVYIAGLDKKNIIAARKLNIIADYLLEDLVDDEFDLIVIPGGPGVYALSASSLLQKVLIEHLKKDRPIGAICAAPIVALQNLGLLKNRRMTCYFSLKDQVKDGNLYIDEPVVVDGNFITSQGPGSAVEFSLKLTEVLFGKEKRKEIAQAIMA